MCIVLVVSSILRPVITRVVNCGGFLSIRFPSFSSASKKEEMKSVTFFCFLLWFNPGERFICYDPRKNLDKK